MIAASHIKYPEYIFYSNGQIYSLKQYRGRNCGFMKPSYSGKYLQISLSNKKKKSFTVHKLISEVFFGARPKDKCIDHINNNKLDNNIKNLRYITYQHNRARAGKINSRNKSGLRGVYFDKTENKWVATIRKNKIRIFHKLCNTKEDAIEARKNAEIEYFKEFD